MNNSFVLSTFIKQLDECLEDIMTTYPNAAKTDDRFLKCKMYFDALKMSNPRLMIMTWKAYVNDKYRERIDAGDINFFLEKEYESDAAELYSTVVESAINDLRVTIRGMSEANVAASMKYVQNLVKLAELYKS